MKDTLSSSGLLCTPTTVRERVPFATNTLVVVGSQLVRYGLTLATWTVIARLLGPKVLGEVQLAYLLPGWILLLTNFGLPLANIYFLGKQTYSLSQMLGNVLLRWSVESCVVISVLFLARELVLKYVKVSPEVYVVIVCWIPLQILNSYLTSILTAQMRFFAQLWINLVQGVAVILAVLLAAGPLGLGTVGAVAGLVAATGLVVLLELWFLRSGFTLQKVQNMRPPLHLIRECFRFGLRGYFANLAQFVTYRFDSFIVSYLLGITALGIYAAAYTAAEMIGYLPGCVATVVFPATAVSSVADANWRTARLSRMSVAFVSLTSMVAAAIAPWLFPALLGTRFADSILLFWLLLPGTAMLAAAKVITADLLGRGFPQYASRGSVGGLVAIAGLNVWLIPKYGLMAAAVSSSLVYGGQAIYWVTCLKRLTGMNARDLLVLTPDDLRLAVSVFSRRTGPLYLRLRSLFATA